MIRRVAAFALLPLATTAIYAGWYAQRSLFFSFFLYELNVEAGTLSHAYELSFYAGVVGTMVAALLGLGLGGRLVLLLGTVCTAVSMAALVVSEPLLASEQLTIYPLLATVAFSQGMLGPALYACAADAMQAEWGALRTATIAAIYGAVNASALATTLGSEAMGQIVGAGAIFGASAMLVGATIWVPLVLIFAPGEPEESDPANTLNPERLGLSVGLIAMLAVPMSIHWHVSTHWWNIAQSLSNAQTGVGAAAWMSVNPATIAAIVPMLVMSLVALQVSRIEVPDLLPAGLGMMLTALSSFILTFDPATTPAQVYGAAFVIGSVGELLFAAFIVSRVLGDAHWRLTTGLAAGWMLANRLGPMILNIIIPIDSSAGAPTWMLWGDIALTMTAGLGLLIAAGPVYQWTLSDRVQEDLDEAWEDGETKLAAP